VEGTFVKDIHVFCGGVFLGTYLVKTILFLSDLPRYRLYKQRTVFPELAAGIGFLITGICLVFLAGLENIGSMTYLEILLIPVAVPLGVIGFRKSDRLLVVLSAMLFMYVFGIVLTENPYLMGL